MQNEIYQFQHGAGQPHVYSDDIKTLQIPLLSIQEQHDIVNNIQKIELSINDFEKNIENLKNNIGETISDLWK
jgi:restriction endonuclease S subunit